MRRIGSSVALLLFVVSPAAAQIVVTTPAAGTTTVGPANDYASRAFQDAWDMSEYTDLGWLTYGSDQPPVNLSGISVSGGIFSGVPTSGDPNFWLLDSFLPGSAPLGKIGSLHPVDTSVYRVLAMRMRLSERPAGDQAMQILWSNNTMFPGEPGGGLRTSNSVLTYEGWNIYIIDLVSLGSAAGPGWSGTVDSIRIDPTQYQVSEVEVDWVRLVPLDNTNLLRSVEWTGTRVVDIFLDNDSNEANGTLGQVAWSHDGGAAASRTFPLYVGGLAPGDYYVGLRGAGSADPLDYSPGVFRVLALPTLAFMSPSEEGSGDDFATVQLNDAWDMSSTDDADASFGLVGPHTQGSVDGVDEAGASLGSLSVIQGTSAAAAVGDPIIYWLLSAERGWNNRIDADRYRILTFDLNLPGARNVLNGSIARVIWKIAEETDANVSQDIVINHREGANVFARVIADMKTLELETEAGGSPSTTGWANGGGGNPGINDFRIDPHEFSTPTSFAFARVKLATFERAGASYTVNWSFSNPSSLATTLRLVADLDRAGCDGITIATGLDPSLGSFEWTIPASFNDGEERYVCAEVLSGPTVINRVYSVWPIVREVGYTGPLPRLVPERSVLRFGAVNDGGTLTARTPAQDLVITQVGAGTANWSALDDQPWLQVTPQDSSGTSVLTAAIIDSGGLPPSGLLRGTLTISGTGIDNSPQYVDVYLALKAPGASAAPFGVFDTPANGATGVTGAIPVTGWALDDLGVDRVEIWRDPVAGLGESAEIFVGNATFVAGARPDVEAIYADTTPRAHLAGWGFQLLTNFLPDRSKTPTQPFGGNGTFTLHAYAVDEEGTRTLLGSKTITCDNANANTPFGTIDTPPQGGTASGASFVNFAWALTPQPGTIPVDGSTLIVFVDGVPQPGNPSYNHYRSDVASAFPGYANSDGAVGVHILDTTAYSNGVHTISWSVTDDLGRSSGIGSRFFSILNGVASLLPDGAVVQWSNLSQPYGPELGRPLPSVLGRGSTRQRVTTDLFERLDVLMDAPEPTRGAAAYLVDGDLLGRLPPGARFDPDEGRFTWTPPPGFAGDYRFVFIYERSNGRRLARDLSVGLGPRKGPPSGN